MIQPIKEPKFKLLLYFDAMYATLFPVACFIIFIRKRKCMHIINVACQLCQCQKLNFIHLYMMLF